MKFFIFLLGLLTLSNSYTYNYNTGMTCGNKHKCSQMNSCKEAYFYLEVCGVTKLNRENDGIPCEKICE